MSDPIARPMSRPSQARPPRLLSFRLGLPALPLLAQLLGCDAPNPEVTPAVSPPLAESPSQADVSDARPDAVQPAAFADPASCAGCHPTQQAAWAGSQHDRAMEPATPATVLGDFDDATFTHFGVTTRFRREGERYWVLTEGPDGAPTEYEVTYTFGVEPLQQYLIPFPGGRLQGLTIAWDTERREWFSLYPEEAISPEDPLHWTGPMQRWNTMCAECHSTALSRGYDLTSDIYTTERVALDVSCQACHGPAGAHVTWAQSGGSGARPPEGADPFSASSGVGEVEVCAPCHSRRHRVSARAVPGDPFLDHYAPELLRPDLYHADGQIDAEVYVYGSFAQSRMHRRGVRCSDCHEPHAMQLRAEGNDLCTRCHASDPDPRFPTLASRGYDTPEHHFHPPGTAGAACVACHMPEKTYMQVDPRRDHSLRVPRPDLSVSIGTPNACNGCHLDRDAGWAADFLAARRPLDEPLPLHFGVAIDAGRRGAPDAVSQLRDLAGSSEQPAIARATAVAMLAPATGDPDVASVVVGAASDDDPLLRVAAAGALEGADPSLSVPVLARLVEDERRAVRVQAAQVLSGLALDTLSPAQHDAFARSLDEYRETQIALGDTPEAHLNLGVLAARRGRGAAAENAYVTAIRLRSDFVPARVNLANLLNAQGRNDEAEAQLRAALASLERLQAGMQDDLSSRASRGEVHYSLALLFAEVGRLDEAASELGEAARLLPTRSRVIYNHGLALQQLGRREEAEAALLRAESLAPGDPAIQNALAIFYAQGGLREPALRHARRLIELTRGGSEARALLGQIEAMPEVPTPR